MTLSYVLDLETAVRQIAGACHNTRETTRYPFVFVVGAGVCAPFIPTSGEIIRHCRAAAGRRSKGTPPAGATPLDLYSYWLLQAYPNARQRQLFIQKISADKRIAPANWGLAHLLGQGQIAKLVLTPNFDDSLPRALSWLGTPFVTCDHPGTCTRIDPESDVVQVVQVHGSHQFYDCCNLRDEVEARASTADGTMTMGTLLDGVFARRSPIVIGYSGWEGDVIMGALRRRLQHPLPYNLYWFAYDEAAIASLPAWLRSHPQVRIVSASASTAPGKAAGGGARRTGRLAAAQVIDRLARASGLRSPEFTRDPIGLLAKRLRHAVPASAYWMPDALFAFGDLPVLEGRARLASTSSAAQPRLVSVAARRLASSRPDAVATFIRTRLGRASALGARGASGEALAICTDVIRRFGTHEDARIRAYMAFALEVKGKALINMQRLRAALATFDVLLARFERDRHPQARLSVARARFCRVGVALKQGRNEAAIALADAMVARTGRRAAPEAKEGVAWALLLKALALAQRQRYAEALESCDDLLRRFGNERALPLRCSAARTLVLKGAILVALGRVREGLTVCRGVTRRFGRSSDARLIEVVASARLSIAHLLAIEDRAAG